MKTSALLSKIKGKSFRELINAAFRNIDSLQRAKRILIRAFDFCLPFVRKGHMEECREEIARTASKTAFIVSPMDTLDELELWIEQRKKGLYLRFGDGDIVLSLGKRSHLQKADQNLAKEMKEALLIKGEDVFKCLMIHSELFGKSEFMSLGNHQNSDSYAFAFFKETFEYFVGYRIYSHVALHYGATYHVRRTNSFLKKLKKDTRVFVGNEAIPRTVINRLFGDVPHIKTPSEDSYYGIDEVESRLIQELEKTDGFCVVCIAMGCPGRILMKRIWSKGYNVFLFDFGSLLDGICGYQTRTWLRKTTIDYAELLAGL